MKYVLALFAMVLLLASCLKEDKPFKPLISLVPKNIGDGWSFSDPKDQQVDEDELTAIYESLYEQDELFQLRSLLVIRNNRIIAESYFKDRFDITNKKPIWSCTKQIVGVLTGIAIQQGLIDSLNSPISNYLSAELQNHPDKSNITIADLLTMQGALDFDESKDVSALLQLKPDNVLDYILSKPLLSAPGQSFRYNSGETHLIAASIQNAANQKLDTWANTNLFSKIGFNNYSWLEYDGYNYGGFGISTTPREMAKIAQLVLNKGTWSGQQVVDSTWIKDMVKTKVGTGSNYTFGNLWWVSEADSLHFMAGSGGQYAVIIPDKNMIVVCTSEHDTDGKLELDFDDFLKIVGRIRAIAD